ncbi:hypothetical protein TNIN_439471 [Trichonephila inaurata madagascariensis]|uniref:Uncharacterized protein n=1 Tax=Trichonephila inaurata madagascariensis TaxID=2747483 RepID=A0A8X7CIH8_9ARAC|nr:hypothetical protein TNIN_439471 [Trichonephila inaurata madagascariensis]
MNEKMRKGPGWDFVSDALRWQDLLSNVETGWHFSRGLPDKSVACARQGRSFKRRSQPGIAYSSSFTTTQQSYIQTMVLSPKHIHDTNSFAAAFNDVPFKPNNCIT